MTMTQKFEEHALAQCFGLHRELAEVADTLSRHLAHTYDDADLLRLGATCMRIAAHDALASRDERRTLQRWRECALAERQIRVGTYGALRAGCIDKRTYDEVFRLATKAARVREDERQRVRRQLQRLELS